MSRGTWMKLTMSQLNIVACLLQAMPATGKGRGLGWDLIYFRYMACMCFGKLCLFRVKVKNYINE